jgi:hypothetical protein
MMDAMQSEGSYGRDLRKRSIEATGVASEIIASVRKNKTVEL